MFDDYFFLYIVCMNSFTMLVAVAYFYADEQKAKKDKNKGDK